LMSKESIHVLGPLCIYTFRLCKNLWKSQAQKKSTAYRETKLNLNYHAVR